MNDEPTRAWMLLRKLGISPEELVTHELYFQDRLNALNFIEYAELSTRFLEVSDVIEVDGHKAYPSVKFKLTDGTNIQQIENELNNEKIKYLVPQVSEEDL